MGDKKIAAQKHIYWNLDWNVENLTTQDSLRSEIVSVHFKEEISKWFLEVHPNACPNDNKRDEHRRYLTVHLRLESATTFDFHVQVEFQILQTNGEVFMKGSFEKNGKEFRGDFTSWGYNKFISHNELFDGDLMSNNTLKLVCKLLISVPSSQPVPQLDPPSDFRLDFCKLFEDTEISDVELKPSGAPSDFRLDFCKLFEDTEISDVELKPSVRKVLKAHKAILAARSPVFRRMFGTNMQEAANNVVNIPDFDSETMQELLRFIYCEEVQNLEKVSMKLIYCAEKYEMLKLKKICRDHIIKTMKAENITKILEIADKVSEMETLMDQCVNFLTFYWKDLKQSECDKIPRKVLVRIIDENQRRESVQVATYNSSLPA